MIVVVNGKEKEIADSISLKDLLNNFGIKPENVIVELNRDIVDRDDFDRLVLKENDKIEIVHFVGGG